MKVLLIGFMGAGKTTAGRLLADRLQLPFFDLDDDVESSVGASVRQIFEHRGEPEFRRLEREALDRLLQTSHAVIATGGGTLAENGNIDLLPEDAVTVWLDTSLEVIAGRVGAAGADQRPLYRDAIAVRELYRQRLPTYRKADIRVEVASDDTQEKIVDRIVALLPGSLV